MSFFSCLFFGTVIHRIPWIGSCSGQTPATSGAQDCDDHAYKARWACDKDLDLGVFWVFLEEIYCGVLFHLHLLLLIASFSVSDCRHSWLVHHRSGQTIAFDMWGSYVRPICTREGDGWGEKEREREKSLLANVWGTSTVKGQYVGNQMVWNMSDLIFPFILYLHIFKKR